MPDQTQRPITIGVAGGTASGKSTVAAKLLEQAGSHRIAHLAHDSYYREIARIPRTPGGRLNYDHPDSLETSLMVEHIRRLRAGNRSNNLSTISPRIAACRKPPSSTRSHHPC